MDPNQLLAQIQQPGLPPVHLWNPPFCGDMDITIKRDGTWIYMGTPIGRKSLVRLFSTIIRKDDDQYFLVTPVEKVGIKVEDAPFTAVLMDTAGTGDQQVLKFTDNVGNEFVAGEEHPIRVDVDAETGEPSPYIRVRDNLEALICRNVFYQMVELAEEMDCLESHGLGIRSQGQWFYMGSIDD
ncbi:DUF1285 domain-containing protein [Pleionea sp. CnH1-48]|uniref:DUF1285 domain-containing protein n=1 Tax=Pleionea sp. CnH1-48 TaxID=2954494 RepID=UPI0020979462|nr:DUF1285 domain-containing protein [Pleionea sp. CnH1-48]